MSGGGFAYLKPSVELYTSLDGVDTDTLKRELDKMQEFNDKCNTATEYLERRLQHPKNQRSKTSISGSSKRGLPSLARRWTNGRR